MKHKVNWIIIYLVLNIIFIIIPQLQKNNELKSYIENSEKLEVIHTEKTLNPNELIYTINDTIEKNENISKSLVCNKSQMTCISIYEIELVIEGQKANVNECIIEICEIPELELDKIEICNSKKCVEAKLKLNAMGDNCE